MARRHRVLVVDDSAFMRKVISDLLGRDPRLEVAGTARDGLEAMERVAVLHPDVITLDVEMPRLDGLSTLRAIMQRWPTPVVMVSSLTHEGAEATIGALALGAVDFVAKPSGTISLDMHTVGAELAAKVRAAARATPRFRPAFADLPVAAGRQPAGPGRAPTGSVADRVVVIGASTGGPGALHHLLPRLPGTLPAAVLVVQHMPAGFTRSLAARLDNICSLQVSEAVAGELVAPGRVLVAPGGQHLVIAPDGRVQLNQDAPLHGVRPAVDVTLLSVAELWRERAVGVILTGMGSDGKRGMLALAAAGGRTIAESQETCVVYGMPRAVAQAGAAEQILPLHRIADALARLVTAATGVVATLPRREQGSDATRL